MFYLNPLSHKLPSLAHPLCSLRKYPWGIDKIQPWNCAERKLGPITVDNREYGRYSGEVQLLRRTFPADGRVNVIGQVAPAYLPLTFCVKNGSSFTLTPWS